MERYHKVFRIHKAQFTWSTTGKDTKLTFVKTLRHKILCKMNFRIVLLAF